MNNYRPITLRPIISKIFENFLLDKFAKYLCTDDLQFGFKKHLSCSHAIFVLKQTIQYFNDNNSNVFLASLDASKAFDRVNHFKLFSILVKMNVPKIFISLIVNWYSKLTAMVKWDDHLSDSFAIRSGVRQGGILSPLLFNCYVNSLLVTLRNKDLGCKLRNFYVGCIMYADDLILISASIMDLQAMLDICLNVGSTLGLQFNSSKSHCISIGPFKTLNLPEMFIGNLRIDWQEQIKYLGVQITSHPGFEIDLTERRRFLCLSIVSCLKLSLLVTLLSSIY